MTTAAVVSNASLLIALEQIDYLKRLAAGLPLPEEAN